MLYRTNLDQSTLDETKRHVLCVVLDHFNSIPGKKKDNITTAVWIALGPFHGGGASPLESESAE